jgi:hypothetical protein
MSIGRRSDDGYMACAYSKDVSCPRALSPVLEAG